MRRFNQGGTPRRASFQSCGTHQPSNGPLTMLDEARNTQHSHSGFDRAGFDKVDRKLRTRPVHFTASKPLIPSEDLPLPQTRTPAPAPPDSRALEKEVTTAQVTLSSKNKARIEVGGKTQEPAHHGGDDAFFVDLISNKGKNAFNDQAATQPNRFPERYVIHKVVTRNVKVPASKQEPQKDEIPATAESSSDGEVILFKGRAKHQILPRQTHKFTIRQLERKLVDVDISNDQAQKESANDTDAAMDDYARNVQAGPSGDEEADDLLLNSTFGRRALGGSYDEIDMGVLSDDDNHASNKAVRGGINGTSQKFLPQIMEDEHLARLLTRQEELGFGGDDLELFDDRVDDEPAAPAKLTNPSKAKGLSERNLMKSRRLKGPRPSASEVADAFDDFDVMDWSRASLQKKNKNALPVASDSELEAAMQSSYQKDRLKKAAKKEARQELRAQGLLGKNVNPMEPQVKYQTGMILEDVKTEVVAFLLGTDETLAFPPMDANTRKALHELSANLKLKSKSAGKGSQRHTTLSRTKFTTKYSASEIDYVFARVGRRYFPRMDQRGPQVNIGGGRRGASGVATVRDGDVVGGAAPEIGTSNRGRTMLEKMGWSSGMALGAVDNKGITQPIEHIVKKSKAGLG